jgi:hypothetical protein
MKAKSLTILGIGLFSAALLAPTAAFCTTLLRLDLEDLTLDADCICLGRVSDSTVFSRGNRLYTLHRIEITESISGDKAAGDTLEVVTAGGSAEGLRQKVSGAAALKVGEEYLFFLEQRGETEIVHPIGMSQGAYPVALDASTAERVVLPPTNLPRLVQKSATGDVLKKASLWLNEKKPLDDVLEAIRAVKKRGKK